MNARKNGLRKLKCFILSRLEKVVGCKLNGFNQSVSAEVSRPEVYKKTQPVLGFFRLKSSILMPHLILTTESYIRQPQNNHLQHSERQSELLYNSIQG